MNYTHALLSALFALSACAGGAISAHDIGDFQPTRDQRVSWRQAYAQCPTLRDVDFAAIAARGDNSAEIRRLWDWPASPSLDGAQVVLRLAVPPGFGGHVTTQTTARRVDSGWVIRRTDRTNVPAARPAPSGSPYDYLPQRSRYPITITDGALDAETSARLDAALNDPCFALEPDATPQAFPLRSGDLDVCYDGPGFSFQVERADGVRTMNQACETRFRAGEIIRILESVNPPGAVRAELLTPLIVIKPDGSEVQINDDGSETILSGG